ncbi:MAG: hypothetical protein P1V35_13530, partial [Planctomycetota bacterium]|nr:hypothetical protein [Planctomycetota bacterium]
WSGIAATFCPTMILSLFWSKFTARGAKCAMIAGFLAVPFLKFAAPPILNSMDLAQMAGYLADLEVLLPSFLVGFAVAVIVSLMDKDGQAQLTGIADELQESRTS